MRLHVLTGCRELLEPEFLAPEEAAGLIGPGVEIATAYWIAPGFGNKYHGFLQDEPGDGRTEAMAQALKDNFGTRFEPLLVLDELLGEAEEGQATAEDRRSQLAVLSEILACGHIRKLRLYGVALPSKADPEGCWAVPAGVVPGTVRERIERLRAASAIDTKLEAVDTRVIEATPDLPAFSTLYNNSVCNHLVLRLAPRLQEHGWAYEPDALAAAISKVLATWNRRGIFLTLPLRAEHLDAMTGLVYEKLL